MHRFLNFLILSSDLKNLVKVGDNQYLGKGKGWLNASAYTRQLGPFTRYNFDFGVNVFAYSCQLGSSVQKRFNLNLNCKALICILLCSGKALSLSSQYQI